MKLWKNHFKESVLKKGLELVEDHQIVDIYRSETGIDGIVQDEDSYEVEIMLNQMNLINMACTCEEADEGNTCCHMAALLYAFEQNKLIADYRSTAKIHYTNAEVSDVINLMSEDELRSLVKEISRGNEKVCFNVMIRKMKTLTEKMFQSLKDEVDEIQRRHQDHSGFIAWDHASAYGLDLRCFLDDYAYVMIQHGCNMMAFDLICEVFLNVSTCDMDDSSDEFGFVSERCYELWKMIVQQCSIEELNTIRFWFKVERQNELLDFACDFLNGFLELELKDKRLLTETLTICDRQIQSAGDDVDCGRVYRSYGENNAVLRRIETMKLLGCSEDGIQTYMKKHRQFFVIRELEIEQALKKEDDQRVLDLLLDSKKLDVNYPTQIRKYTELLIEWYQRNHQIDHLIKECRELTRNYVQYNLDAVKLLKKYLNEKDWKYEFSYLRKLDTMKPVIFDLLMLEKCYHEVIEQSRTLTELDRFRESLMLHEQNACCRKYALLLDAEMDNASIRKHYAILAEYLGMMSSYDGGGIFAHELAKRWKFKYPRRFAMLQELKNAGF